MNFETFDVVALLKNIPEYNLVKGHGGSIVDSYTDGN